jgi:proteasome lid subunit RPN8/RPN11
MKSNPTPSDDASPLKVAASSSSTHKPVRKPFPGPRGAQAGLRVAVDRQAHADLIAHAKESLHAEVCGVLVGEDGVDDEGPFIHVQAVIRGAQASGGSTHVTFTHETWESIHKTMESDHPKQRMVGWYHTHPGFGVEFSEMDLFIQRNFFSLATQIALVTDPIAGSVAIAANGEHGGIQYLPRYWVDGREHPASMPAGASRDAASTGTAASADVQALEHRLNQTTLAVEDLRVSLHRFLLFAGGLVAIAMVVMVTFLVRDQFRERVKPPELNHFVQVPVKIGDKNVLIGVGVVSWQVPDELNGLMIDMERLRLEEEKKTKGDKPEAAKPTDGKPEPANPQSAKPGERTTHDDKPKAEEKSKPDEKTVVPPAPAPAPGPQPPPENR